MKVCFDTRLVEVSAELSKLLNSTKNQMILVEYGDLMYRHSLMPEYFKYMLYATFHIIAFKNKLNKSVEDIRNYFFNKIVEKDFFESEDFLDIKEQDLLYPDLLKRIQEFNADTKNQKIINDFLKIFEDVMEIYQKEYKRLMCAKKELEDIFTKTCLLFEHNYKAIIEKDFNIELEMEENE